MLSRFRHWLSRSISHRLVFYSTATATVLAALLGAAAIPIIAAQAIRNFDDELRNSVSRITDRIELRIDSTLQNLQQLAKNSFVVNAFVDSTGREIYLQPTLRDFVLPFGVESQLVLFDASANPFAANKVLSPEALPEFATLARAALAEKATRIAVHPSGATLTNPADKADNAATVAFAIPIYYPPASDYEGVLVGIVPLAHLLSVPETSLAADECLSIANGSVPIYRTACRAGEYVASRQHSLIDELPESLMVTFSKSRAGLYWQLGRLVLGYFLIAALVIVATYWVSRRSSRRFSQQLQSLGAASRELVSNPQAQVSLTWPNPDEIGEFAGSFSRMVSALQELHAGLEKRVGERTVELALALTQAEAANTAKSQFLATMSHEIRTPLNGVLGMAQLLAMADVSEDERREYVQTIIDSGQALLTILNDILDFSKVEAGSLELVLAPFAPADLLEQVQALFGQVARKKGLMLTTEWQGPGNTPYLADAGRLRQMLANLVGNAVKFANSGSVHVVASELRRESATATLKFAVSDTGIGIASDKQALLFKPFSQVDASTTRVYGGTGLGLSIVRSFAHVMGGEVGVSSEPGVGSTFWFTVTLALDQEAEQAIAPAPVFPAQTAAVPIADRSGKILVVEDSETNRTVICGILRHLGYASITASDGQEAVARITTGSEHVIAVLMDIQMPVLNGLEATRLIRDWEHAQQQPPLPIIALTAGAFAEDRERCLAAGMGDFLTKPVNVADLVSALARALPGSQG